MGKNNNQYKWANCCIADDYWTECETPVMTIKNYDWDYKANDKGKLTYKVKLSNFQNILK